jgi:ferric-dicitrate binding protein FerR (iron transport regulator)
MSTDPKVAELLAPMRDRAADTGARRFKVDREKILSRMIEVSMSEGEAPSRRVRTYAALALAAGFALIAAGAGYKAMHGTAAVATVTAPHLDVVALEGEVARVQGSARMGIAPGHTTAVAPDGAIETSAHAQARIKTENGLEIDLRENTRVSLNDMNGAEPRVSLHLDSGAIRCVVPHLADGHSFSVVTPDARVVDRGTIFTVSVMGIGAAARTVVRVEEGTVVVQHASGETQLTATQSWGSSSPAAEQPTVVAPIAGSTESVARGPAAAGARRTVDTPKQPKGTLGEETSLLQLGLANERKGDLRGAAVSFESLLSRYPESPLAPDARAALSRVKGSLGSQR